jgi:hypothetical protein
MPVPPRCLATKLTEPLPTTGVLRTNVVGAFREPQRAIRPRRDSEGAGIARRDREFVKHPGRRDPPDVVGATVLLGEPQIPIRARRDTAWLATPRGDGVLRWYTYCYRTPIGNTAASPRFPVIAVVHSFTVHGADGRSRDELLGPPLCRIYERSALGPLPPNAPPPGSLRVFARRASKIFGWWVLGLGRPSPLFDERTNAPRAVPRALTRSERAGL